MVHGKIIWVDEDERIWDPERWLLRGLGLVVEALSDATSAWEIIRVADLDQVSLIVLDVMLLQGDDMQLFSDTETMGGLRTGLVLARRLCKENPRICKKILFFSRVSGEVIAAEIMKTAKDIGAHFLQKSPQTQGRHFIHWLRANRFI